MGLESLFGGGDSEQETSAGPWAPQQKYLKDIFSGAQQQYQQGAPQYYQGQNVAGTNQALQGYMSGMGGYYQQGLGAGQNMMQAGQQAAGGQPQAQQFYSEALNNYYNPYASAEYQDVITQNVANNPALDAQIAAAQGSINRNMQENILPSISGASVATGNTGSTRRGVAEGVAMRGAAEAGAGAELDLRTNAYNQAIDQANRWAGSQESAQFGAAQNLAGMGAQGLQQQAQGYGMGTQAYQDLMAAGMYERALEGEQIAGDMERWDFEQQAPWMNLNNYYNLVGGNFGTESVTEGGGQGAGPGMMGMAAQLGSAYLMS